MSEFVLRLEPGNPAIQKAFNESLESLNRAIFDAEWKLLAPLISAYGVDRLSCNFREGGDRVLLIDGHERFTLRIDYPQIPVDGLSQLRVEVRLEPIEPSA